MFEKLDKEIKKSWIAMHLPGVIVGTIIGSVITALAFLTSPVVLGSIIGAFCLLVAGGAIYKYFQDNQKAIENTTKSGGFFSNLFGGSNKDK